jgi:hypothetical protein
MRDPVAENTYRGAGTPVSFPPLMRFTTMSCGTKAFVYSYEMHLDDRKISVSLATFELTTAGTGTRLVMTEQGAFLDGYDDAGSRERGSNFLLDALGQSLQ